MTLSVGCVTISYNQGKYLRSCIDSVDREDRASLRHVIVDPGSSDDSRDIIAEYARENRFHAVILEPDEGPGDGLNKGFARLAEAEILCYLNSDDCLCPGALEVVADWFEKNPGVDVLTGAVAVIDASGRRHWRKRLSAPFTPKRFMNDTAWVFQQATFFRRSALMATRGFNVRNRTCWDTELLIDMFLAGARFSRVNRLLGEFRVYPGTISHGLATGGLSRAYLEDQQRLRHKLLAAGHLPLAYPLDRLCHWSYRLNPLRRWMEIVVT